MNNEEPDETYKMLRETAREFSRKQLQPLSDRVDEEDYFPVDLFKSLGKLGFLGITVPEEFGGSGLDYRAQSIVQEELGYASAGFALSYGAHSNLVTDSIYRNGSDYIRKTCLPKLCSGEWIGSLCLTEPGSGSDALAMKTNAVKSGEYYVLNGSKTLITNAPYADLMLVYAKTGDDYTAFVVLKTDAGVSKGKKFSKMGMRGSPTGEIFFENVKLGEDRILGKFGKGKDIILSGLNSERIILSFIFVGLLKRAIELSLKYANERKQFGQNLGEFEMIQEKIAYMYTKFRTSKLLCNYALESLKFSNMNAIDAAAAILYTAESAEYAAREAIQIHGGYGYIRGSEVERLLRDAILGQIGAGTTEIRKKLVASGLLKYYKKNERLPDED
jgi:isovaleryl-CoA dehydrogenase